MIGLQSRLVLILIAMGTVIYFFVSFFLDLLGVGGILFYLIVTLAIVFIQYWLGPNIIAWTMKVRYIRREENPWLYKLVEEQAKKAKIPMPKVAISSLAIPNAFAFGRSIRDGRVCVTQEIINLLNEQELKAVIGHEISHIKNRDMLFITLLSVIPLLLYRIFIHTLWFGGGYGNRRRDNGSAVIVIGIVAFLLYIITNLFVLYASRIREYYADQGSIKLGNSASALASALYKLVYGAARTPAEYLRQTEGVKAFFLNDVSRSRLELSQLSDIDLDRNGTIDTYELKTLSQGRINLSLSQKIMEIMSTHPNMLKRIKQLANYS